ncbi:hypothetical protein J4405_00440 [Candidatus Woesearchaeota archaeon]|nr:hypothetical protein [Candidatus Woesearchaeota archaeon]
MIKEAKMEEWRNMSANLVKIGNSLSVRIPASTIKELSLKENDILALKVRKFNIDETAPEAIKKLQKAARNRKELESFSDEKITLMAKLAYNEGRYILSKVKNNISEDSKNQKNMAKYNKEYQEMIKEEYGKKIYEDLLLFIKIVYNEVFEKDKKTY